MNTSDTINELAAALAKAQGEMGNAPFNRTNPHFKSKYADLASVRDAVTPALAKHGLSVTQTMSPGEGNMLVHTRLMHSSGQWMESVYPIINDTNKPQIMGSALTYARRYSLAALCGIASEEDDDGNEATKHGNGKDTDLGIKPNDGGLPGASRAKARPGYTELVEELRKVPTVSALDKWGTVREPDIKMLPAGWVESLRQDFRDWRAQLEETAAQQYAEHKAELLASG